MKRAIILLVLTATCLAEQVTVPQGTEIRVRLTTALDSSLAKPGDTITMEAIDDVTLNGATVIYRNALVLGKVTKAKPGRTMGRGGELGIKLETVKAVDGSLVPIATQSKTKGKDGYGVGSAIGVTVTGLVFFPAGPLWLLKHGHKAEVPYGSVFVLSTAKDATVDLANALPAPKPVTAPAPIQAKANGGQLEHQVRGETISGPSQGTAAAAPSHAESLGEYSRRIKALKEAEKAKRAAQAAH